MRTRLLCILVAGAGLGGPAWAEGGLSLGSAPGLSNPAWPRMQARIGLSLGLSPLGGDGATGLGLHGAQVLGDYYFGSPGSLAGHRLSGGFRATSGLMLNGGLSLGMQTVPRLGGSPLTLSSQEALPPLQLGDSLADNIRALPYVGVGYTGLSTSGTWGFTADLGVLGDGAAGLRAPLGQPLSLPSLDETLHLTPTLQFGISYTF